MRIDLGIMIGQHPHGWASKIIELDFAPTIGMSYNDGTWKGVEGRKIINVSIECPPDETPYLVVSLTPDNSATVEDLKATYEAWGWKVS